MQYFRLLGASMVALLLGGCDAASKGADARPHLWFILSDDQGYNSIGFHNKDLITPNVNALVKEGRELTRQYVYKFCSPTRTSFVSGRLPIHVNQENSATEQPLAGIPLGMTTIAERMNATGYSCHQVGKWHCGQASKKHIPSGRGNHLGQRHKLVNASQHPIIVGGNVRVFGMWFDPGYGYHVDKTRGIPTGNEPESIYAVMSGTHTNDKCCFDYGNSETNDRDDGCGAMEAIYFGNAHWHGNTGAGETGPWVGADLEQGMYYGGGNVSKNNTQNQPLPHEFVTLYLRGRTDGFVLKGADATAGTLTTMYDGPRPTHGPHCSWSHNDYQPMQKQGAIILATGGDESNSAMGKFYEGIMVLGNTTDATDEAVQANIVGVGYMLPRA